MFALIINKKQYTQIYTVEQKNGEKENRGTTEIMNIENMKICKFAETLYMLTF